MSTILQNAQAKKSQLVFKNCQPILTWTTENFNTSMDYATKFLSAVRICLTFNG